MNIIEHRFLNVTGDFDLNKDEIISVSSKKYARVDLCFKANMHIPFARIILYSKDRFVDAEECFASAEALGQEIERRWKLQTELAEAKKENERLKALVLELNPPNRHDHDYFHDDCYLCQVEKQAYEKIQQTLKENLMAKIPKKPKGLWMLWNINTNDWVLSIDDPVTHLAYLCADSKEAALALQEHQEDNYVVKSVIVRVI